MILTMHNVQTSYQILRCLARHKAISLRNTFRHVVREESNLAPRNCLLMINLTTTILYGVRVKILAHGMNRIIL
ncbi:hypothetical protein FGO68_gene16605 [Halteria grandinella]|uniref:Uncharacterized protein n=1 Tax=Halteria grandinella TaxID=5974 RepID=A0A8J8T300_HALGN|nr:hypothetical protein FGO68_gene16605 [Halteria grandinella]